MITGQPPYDLDKINSIDELFDTIKFSHFDENFYSDPKFSYLSSQVKNFLCLLLKNDPILRYNAEQLLAEKFIKDI